MGVGVIRMRGTAARRAGVAGALAVAALTVGCSSGTVDLSGSPTAGDTASATSSSGPSAPASSSPAGSGFSTPDVASLVAGSTVVRFRSSDGVRLSGRLFGSGHTGVVLSHMIRSDQQPWWWMASVLADHGIMTLTYDQRGTCPGGPAGCSAGTLDPGATDQDILGAVDYLRSRGADRVIIGGASLGGTASLWVAAKHPEAVDGVFTLSAVPFFPPFDITGKVIAAIGDPKLFVAGERDPSAGPYVAGWKRAARPPVQAVVLPTSTHGTDLFADPDFSVRVRSVVLRFCRRIARR
jgi:dienelactone hydrolase